MANTTVITAEGIGYVRMVQGLVIARAEDGTERVLSVGDIVYPGEVIETSDPGAVLIELRDGTELTLGLDSRLVLDPEVYGFDTEAERSEQISSIEDVQRAIAAGADPTEVTQTTAAGPDTGIGGADTEDDTQPAVIVQRIGEEVRPDSGFETGTFGDERIEFPDDLGVEEVLPGESGPVVTIPDTDGTANATDSTLPESAGPTAGDFTISAPAGLSSLDVGGTTLTPADLNNLGTSPVTITTTDGSLVLTGYNPATGQVSYTYDPNVLSHTNGQAITDSITITVTAADGQSTSDTLDIAITDSVPTANADSASITEDAAPNTVSGNVTTNDTIGADGADGADGAASPGPVTTTGTFTLAYGSLVLNADGSYTYTLDNANPAVNGLSTGQSLSDSYTYTITDADGSTATAMLTITINGVTDGAPVVTIVEDANNDGIISSSELVGNVNVEIALPSGAVAGDTLTITNPDGTTTAVVLTATDITAGKYLTSYVAPASGQSITVSATLTDQVGNVSASSTDSATMDLSALAIRVDIKDDSGNDDYLDSGDDLTQTALSGQIEAGGSITSLVVSDGTNSINIDPASITVAADGSWSTTVDTSSLNDGTVTVTLNATDAVGNAATAATAATDTIEKDTTASATITVDAVTADNIINAAESGQTIAVTGTVGGDAKAGDTATLNVNGNTYTGQVTADANGNLVYSINVPGADLAADTTVYASVTAIDAAGNPATATTTHTHSVAPIITSITNSAVSEEGLANGLPDATGTPTDTTDSATATGTITFADPDSNAFTLSLSGPTTNLTSGGQSVSSWVWDSNTQTLTGSTAGGTDVMTVKLGNVANTSGGYSVDYTVNLLAPLDHPSNNTEDVLDLQFGLNVSDGASSDTGALTISVEDDRPVSGAISNSLTVPLAEANVMLILDFSGSVRGQNLADMQAAVISMLDAYNNAGYAVVQLVTFSGNANIPADGGWISVADAKAYINGLTDADMGGSTNYDAALAAAQSAFAEAAGKIPGAKNIAYFLSDGSPTSGNGSIGIDPAEQAAWENFLTNNAIDSHAVGFGGASTTELEPIAYNGIDGTERPALDATTAGANLTQVLLDTVAQTVPGNLFGSLATGGFGADGAGIVTSLTVGGVTYAYDSNNDTITGGSSTLNGHQLTVTTSQGGILSVNMLTGEYTYLADPTFTTSYNEIVAYALQDADGDATSGTLTLNVARDVKPVPTLLDNTADVYEAAMSTGTNPDSTAEVATGNILSDDTIPAGLSLSNVSIVGGATVINGNTITVTTAEGKLRVIRWLWIK